MPDIELSAENRIARTGQLDKLTLAFEESARIVLLENPTYAWVHQIRAPKIVDGRPIKVTKTRKGRGGDEDKYETYDFDFIGRPRCLGDYEVIKANGVDPEACPACKASTDGDQIKPPERRFAVNAIRYAMDRNGKLVQPFTCTCLVWAFGERDFDKLVALAVEYQEDGGLIGRDLMLGPCTSAAFQNFDIKPGAKAVWKATDEIKQRVVETFKANRVSKGELENACGRSVTARWMLDDIDRVAARWRIVDGVPAPSDATAPADVPTLAAGLDELLATPAAPAAVAAAAAADGLDLGNLLDTPAATAATPVAPVTADLSDLLGDATPAVTTAAAPAANGNGATNGNGAAHGTPAVGDEVPDFDALLKL